MVRKITRGGCGPTRAIATPAAPGEPLDEFRTRVDEVVQRFRSAPVTPQRFVELENTLHSTAAETCRQVLAREANRLEPDDKRALPGKGRLRKETYRINEKTQARMATRFGAITLRSFYYLNDEDGEPGLHPLRVRLGIGTGSATPALLERLARTSVDHTQSEVRACLRPPPADDRGVVNPAPAAAEPSTVRMCAAASQRRLVPDAGSVPSRGRGHGPFRVAGALAGSVGGAPQVGPSPKTAGARREDAPERPEGGARVGRMLGCGPGSAGLATHAAPGRAPRVRVRQRHSWQRRRTALRNQLRRLLSADPADRPAWFTAAGRDDRATVPLSAAARFAVAPGRAVWALQQAPVTAGAAAWQPFGAQAPAAAAARGPRSGPNPGRSTAADGDGDVERAPPLRPSGTRRLDNGSFIDALLSRPRGCRVARNPPGRGRESRAPNVLQEKLPHL